MLLVALAVGAGLGLLSRSRPGAALLVLAGFVLLGVVAGSRDASTQPTLAVLAAMAELAVGATVLDRLGRLMVDTGRATPLTAESSATATRMPDWSRRSLLLRGGGLALASLAAGALGRVLLDRQRAPVANVPTPIAEVPAVVPPGADLGLDQLTPIVVPNDDFYRIDTALVVPNIDRETWRLRIHGLVDREVTLTYEDLVGLEIVDQYVTIACVSNDVGGDLIGNALWTGVRLRDVLELAGVQAGATQLVGRSADSWTAGMPTAWIMDPEREPMIALAMNGEPLPRQHGYPARLIVPGPVRLRLGHEVADRAAADDDGGLRRLLGAPRLGQGGADPDPVADRSAAAERARSRPGRYTFAGVAWAMDRGVARVEIQVDDGEWREAELSAPISDATWVQWRLETDAPGGDHQVRVRATDTTARPRPRW